MKKVEYSFVHSSDDRLHSLSTEKHDDYTLPDFTKEVPVATKKDEKQNSITLSHSWRPTKSEMVLIKRITFRDSEKFEDLYRIAARDGADSITFKH
ncbi:MAG: hypothetical protein ABID61_05600, partial [Candidatus Micrarchaeota archaeon]